VLIGKNNQKASNLKPSTVSYTALLHGFFLSLILWIIGGIIAWQSFQNIKKHTIEDLKSLGTNLAYHTSNAVESVDSVLVQVAHHFSTDWHSFETPPEHSNDFLITALSGLHQLKDIVIMNAKGEQVFSRQFASGENVESYKDDTAIQLLMTPKHKLSIAKLPLENSIGVSRTVYSQEGQLLGYIVARMRGSFLIETYQAGLTDSVHRFALYNKDERLFSIPESNLYEHDVKKIFESDKAQIVLDPRMQDHDAFTILTKVPHYDLVLSAEVPYDDSIAQWTHQTLSYAFIGIVFTLVILFSSVQIHRMLFNIGREIETRKKVERDLKIIFQAVEQSPASVLITNTLGEIEYVNPKFTETSGYLFEEVKGQNPSMLSSGEIPKSTYAEMWQALLNGGEWRSEFHNRRKDGSLYWENALLSSIKNDQGEITHFLAVKEDITLRKKSEEQLELAAAVFDAASEAIMVCDAHNRIEMVNSSYTDITGYTLEEVVGKQPSILKSGRHSAAFYTEMYTSLEKNGSWSGEIWNRRKNGEIYPQWLSIKTTLNEQGKIFRYVSLFNDITNRKRDEERILYQANYDDLTKLPNRSLFLDRLQRALIRAERSKTQIALLFIDLDRFKNVNDSLGHAFGDLLLQEAANRLLACVRKTDTVARLGGDEFTVIIQDLNDYSQIENLVEKLLEELSNAYNLEQNIVYISASIGITIFPNDGTNVQELLKNADSAMYRAKENGRNLSQFYTVEMNEQASQRRLLETALHLALEREELALHYQPIVDTNTGELISCEALLRWHHPEHGNVFPDKFIPLAEDTGLILPIGEWVLLTACREAMIWAKNSQTPPRVAVNMSSKQFQRVDVVELVKKTLELTGLPGSRLTLEITESLLVGDDQNIITQLNGIRDLGVGLSIDDFGTGYSSLSYLRRFPITTLKIDRAFINDVNSNEEAAALVSAILSMAQSLKLKVVAEGVETQDQLEHLRRENCTYIQGYYFSPPVPVEAFRLMVKRNTPLEPDE
jgi:diguanylate cyclase (GGDEF)-like protein/PAS domain S-box-containing protein